MAGFGRKSAQTLVHIFGVWEFKVWGLRIRIERVKQTRKAKSRFPKKWARLGTQGDPPTLNRNRNRYTLHPTPYTLHPTPYTLHPTPCSLHPTPRRA